jgi:predicted kinase
MGKNQFILLIDGPMGGGKTTIANILKTKVTNVMFSGQDRIKWSIANFSRSPTENKIAADMVFSMGKTALINNLSVCIEQGFMRAEYVQPYLDLAKEFKVRFLMFQIEAPKEVLLKRLTLRPAPVEAKEPMTIEKIKENLDTYFTHKYQKAKVIDSENKTPEVIAEIILKELKYL